MRITVTAFFFYVGLCSSDAGAQSLWSHRSDRPSVRLDFVSPQFESTFPGVSYTSQIVTLGGRVPIGELIAVLVEIPFMWETMQSPYQDESNKSVGNPYLGVEIGGHESWIFGEIGARPFMRQEMDISGMGGYFGDFDRFEAYFREVVSYQLAVNVAATMRTGFSYRVRLGPTVVAPESGDQTTFIDYGGRAGFDNGSVSVFAGVTGRAATEKTSGKSAFHHVGLDVGYRFRGIRPAFFIRWPLDKEFKDLTSQTIGGSLTVEW